jgi:hypothetical protein
VQKQNLSITMNLLKVENVYTVDTWLLNTRTVLRKRHKLTQQMSIGKIN